MINFLSVFQSVPHLAVNYLHVMGILANVKQLGVGATIPHFGANLAKAVESHTQIQSINTC